MKKLCGLCGKETASKSAHDNITDGICEACALQGVARRDKRAMLEAIDAPILLMQGNPRQVVSANNRALDLFGKELRDVENHRGGEVFDCIHSFTEAGCGKDANCEGCKIRDAIVDTFTTAQPHYGVATTLQIKKADGINAYALQVSTEKVGDLALVRVERYNSV